MVGNLAPAAKSLPSDPPGFATTTPGVEIVAAAREMLDAAPQVTARVARVGAAGAEPVLGRAEADGTVRSRRRQISHDIRHEIGTIMMLASLLSGAEDVGSDSRDRARQVLGEARWLEQLLRAYEDTSADPPPGSRPASWTAQSEPLRLDLIATEVVAAMRLSTLTAIDIVATPAWARVDRLAFWRALRNVVGNAVRAAGHQGTVTITVAAAGGWVVAQIEDDGPGFGAAPPGLNSLGLGIVQDLVASWGGELEIRRGGMGGCCVSLRLPAAPDSSGP